MKKGSSDGHGRTNREAMAAEGLQGRCAVVSGDLQFSLCVGLGEKEVEKVSLVDAWNVKVTRHDANHVLIAYQPLMASALNCPGANIQSDGKTLRVGPPKCLVTLKCRVMDPSTVREAPCIGFWYEVLVPYKGERVLVDGAGPVVEELQLSRRKAGMSDTTLGIHSNVRPGMIDPSTRKPTDPSLITWHRWPAVAAASP